MSDYYLRSNTETQMVEAFAAIGVDIQRIDGECHSLDGQRIDIGWIGPISRPDPNNPEGAPIVDTRFHANLRVAGELTEEQAAELPILDPAPSVPMRIWA